MNAKPKVSVLIPTYNYAYFLDETISSVLAQTFTDFELIIVDNCSTDNTKEVVSKYQTDSRVIFHQNEKNLGLACNWNKCLDLANGEFIKMLCADDKLHPQILERFIAVMESHPEVSIVSSYNRMFGKRNIERIPPFNGLLKGSFVRGQLLKEGAKNWLYNPSATMFRKTEAEAIGKFNTNLHYFLDIEFYQRSLAIGDCYIVPEFLSYIRSHDNTESATAKKKRYKYLFERYTYMDSVRKSKWPLEAADLSALDKFIKKHASKCAAFTFKALPGFYKKEERNIVRKALSIGYNEKVLLDPVLRLFKGKVDFKKALKY